MKNKFLILLLISFPLSVQAWQSCGIDAQGNTANCEYEIKDGTLTIRGTGENGNIGYWWSESESYKSPWQRQQFQNVVIEDSIKDLGSYAFYNVTSENPIQIPSSVTTIGFASFQQVTTPEVIIPASVTNIGPVAFFAANVDKINLPDSITSLDSRAFRRSRFTDIVIPDSVEQIGRMAFSWCTNLKSITIGENTHLEDLFIGFGDDDAITDLSKLKIYCTGDTSLCDAHLADSGYPNLKSTAVTTKTINGKTYVYDMSGKRVDRDVKRIYTVTEAEKVSKPTENTFRLRYK